MTLTRNSMIIVGLISVLCFLSTFSLTLGSVDLSIQDIWAVLTNQSLSNPTTDYIVTARLNRTFVALLAGAALAVSGLILQVFFRNPLAGPGVLGISSGAALGVAAVVLGGFSLHQFSGYTLTILAGLTGSIGVLILLLVMSKFIHQMVTLLVIGLMLSYFSSAVLNVLYQWADKESTREFVIWGLGSFSGISTESLWVFSVSVLLTLMLTITLVKPLSALSLGSNYAKSLGINMSFVKWQIIIITGVLTAIVTVFCGPIGFLGMAVPQLARQITKNQNYLFLLPFTMLLGSVLALIADLFVRLFEGGIPLNTATSLIGAPIIIWAIFKLNKHT